MDLKNEKQGSVHLAHVRNMIARLVEKFQPLQIICFGKRTFLTECSGSFIPQAANLEGNYCLLMVTDGSAQNGHEVQDFANAHFKQGWMTILCHSQESVSESIELNSRFFIGVYTHGQLLYSRGGLSNFDFAFWV